MARTARMPASLMTGGLALLVLALTVSVFFYPREAFDASLAGLTLWLQTVLPALLPFFVLAELLSGLGVIRAVGVFLEPIMRPLFRIPGEGAFALAMGLASGCPLGAKITGQLRREGTCTREESERLLAFANTSNPLFIIGAVGIGMLGSVQLGVTLAAAHFLAVFCVGFLLRFHAGGKMSDSLRPIRRGLFKRAIGAMLQSRQIDRRPFGTLFADAVRESMSSMLFVGGCIMLFSVFIRILTVSGALSIAAQPLAWALTPWGVDPDTIPLVVGGMIEVTNGAQGLSLLDTSSLYRVSAISLLIGWSGLSIHAQVAAMVHGTDIRFGPYYLARALHAVLAAGMAWVLYPRMAESAVSSIPVLQRLADGAPPWAGVGLGLAGALAVLGLLTAVALLAHACQRIRILRL